MIRAFLLFAILITAISCGSDLDTSTLSGEESAAVAPNPKPYFIPLTKKRMIGEICGAIGYIVAQNPHCGYIDKQRRAPVCGTIYYERASLSCPGSIKAHDYVSGESGDCPHRDVKEPTACKSGYYEMDYVVYKKNCKGPNKIRGGLGKIISYRSEYEIVHGRARHCGRAESLKTCRHKNHGIEGYHLCRHHTFGVEPKTCAHPRNGVTGWKTCDAHATLAELRTRIVKTRAQVDVRKETLADSTTNIFVFSQNEAAFSCLITDLASDPDTAGKVDKLSRQYELNFGRAYDKERYRCGSQANQLDALIKKAKCGADDERHLCRAIKGYRSNKQWFEVALTDIDNLLADVRRSKLRHDEAKLLALRTEVAEHFASAQ